MKNIFENLLTDVLTYEMIRPVASDFTRDGW